MTTRSRFKQTDLERAIKGATNAGMTIGKVVIDSNGNIEIVSQSLIPAGRTNSMDALLGR